jgi:hypothetical protein
MLQPVEVLRGGRTVLRRAVRMDCSLLSDVWDEPVPHLATDVSHRGMWVETAFPLGVGEMVLAMFTPPRWTGRYRLMVRGTVRHTELNRRRADPRRAGMGIEFIDVADAIAQQIEDSLIGTPPPLAKARRDYTDREVLLVERFPSVHIDGREHAFEALGELLGGGRPRRRRPHLRLVA